MFLWKWLQAAAEHIIRDNRPRGWCGGVHQLEGVCERVVRVWVRFRNRKGWRNTGLNPFYFIFLGRLTPRCYSYICSIFLWVTKNIKRGFSTIQYYIISWSSFRLHNSCLQIFSLFFCRFRVKWQCHVVCALYLILYIYNIYLYTLKLVQTLILV